MNAYDVTVIIDALGYRERVTVRAATPGQAQAAAMIATAKLGRPNLSGELVTYQVTKATLRLRCPDCKQPLALARAEGGNVSGACVCGFIFRGHA